MQQEEVSKKPFQAQNPKQQKTEKAVNVMQEYRLDLYGKEGDTSNYDMPALNPDEFGNETYDPNNPDEVEVSIGEFIPVPEPEAEIIDAKEVAPNAIEEDSQQGPDQMLRDRGEMIFSEEKEIGEPVSADRKANQDGSIMNDSVEINEEIGTYRSADSP